jgi:hypothetical protein
MLLLQRAGETMTINCNSADTERDIGLLSVDKKKSKINILYVNRGEQISVSVASVPRHAC